MKVIVINPVVTNSAITGVLNLCTATKQRKLHAKSTPQAGMKDDLSEQMAAAIRAMMRLRERR
jgi:hypothetical protein